jgi:FixJ family two-component response regulator
MMAERSLIAVVDDDESMRESLPDLLREFGFTPLTFASAEEFLASGCVNKARCLILDITMPGMSGRDLQHELRRRRQTVPIVFMTADINEILHQRILEHGAVECLSKPFSDATLLGAIHAALQIN